MDNLPKRYQRSPDRYRRPVKHSLADSLYTQQALLLAKEAEKPESFGPAPPSTMNTQAIETTVWDTNSVLLQAAKRLGMAKKSFGQVVEFDGKQLKLVEFVGGNYGLVYNGFTPARLVPYGWAEDKETRQTWSIFQQRHFYGSHVFSKWDAVTKNQVPVHVKDTLDKINERNEDERFISQDLALARELSDYEKKKANWDLYIKIIIVALIGLGITYYLYTNPGLLGGISHALSGATPQG